MRVGIASFLVERPADTTAIVDRLASFAQRVERLGFGGIWVGDAMGRGEPTLDPMLALAALSSVTSRIELGVGVLQVPIRGAAELAHRAQTLNVLSKGRFRFGVGVGSTRADFDFTGVNFERRFATLLPSIETMRGIWRGDPQNGVALSRWSKNGSGPSMLLGVWRNRRWISYAAQHCEGWIASGLFSKWDDAIAGICAYREAGGKRAILTNVPIDIRPRPEYADQWAKVASITLTCPMGLAVERLQRIERLGFDDVVLVPPDESLEHLEMVRELVDAANLNRFEKGEGTQ
jgi:alkanesulfonate monooxygenase SsuD/methylene tetrahydromethanopterin reductase-like flavin-dependent oxidoreductase (luciferase family)